MALSGCLKYGVRQHYVAANPLEAVKPPRKEAPKDNIDTVLVEGRQVMIAVQSGDNPDEARWLLAFLGLRRGETLGLPWRNVRGLDGDDPKLVIDEQLAWDKGPGLHVKAWPKNRKSRTIPLSEPWVSALRRQRKRWEAMIGEPGFEFRKPVGGKESPSSPEDTRAHSLTCLLGPISRQVCEHAGTLSRPVNA